MGDMALGLIVMVWYDVNWLKLLNLVRSLYWLSMKVRATATVRGQGAGCSTASLASGNIPPMVLNSSLPAVVSSSIASITQV